MYSIVVVVGGGGWRIAASSSDEVKEVEMDSISLGVGAVVVFWVAGGVG